MFVDHVLCFFQKRRPFCCWHSFLPGVLFSLVSASPTSWDFDDQLELSKRSMPQVDLFVASLSSCGDQIYVNQLFGGKQPNITNDNLLSPSIEPRSFWCGKLNCFHLLATNNSGTLAYPQNIIFSHKTNYVTVQTMWKSPRQYAWSCLW